MTHEERLFTDILLDCSKSIRKNAKSLYNKNSKYYIHRKVIPKQDKYMQDYLIKQLNDALEARELITIKVLENSGLGTREASDMICAKLKCEGIQAIGNKMVLYKKSKKKPKIEIPSK